MQKKMDVAAAKVAMLKMVKDNEPDTSYSFDGLIRQFLDVHFSDFQFMEAEQARNALFQEGLLGHGRGLKRGMVVSIEEVLQAS